MRSDGCRELRVEVTPAQQPRLGPLLGIRRPDWPEALLLKSAQKAEPPQIFRWYQAGV